MTCPANNFARETASVRSLMIAPNRQFLRVSRRPARLRNGGKWGRLGQGSGQAIARHHDEPPKPGPINTSEIVRRPRTLAKMPRKTAAERPQSPKLFLLTAVALAGTVTEPHEDCAQQLGHLLWHE